MSFGGSKKNGRWRLSDLHPSRRNPTVRRTSTSGPKVPAGKEPNWVPTDSQRQFEVLFRLYGPKKELFDKTWKLPDPERL